jgi:hypothetical protein
MSDHHRRGFLRSLAALPLIGGSVALIGSPTAAAVATTPDMIEAYKTWLNMELRFLAWEMAGDPTFIERYRHDPAVDGDRVQLSDRIGRSLMFVGDSGHYHFDEAGTAPSTRAALVLSAVGCDWRRDG